MKLKEKKKVDRSSMDLDQMQGLSTLEKVRKRSWRKGLLLATITQYWSGKERIWKSKKIIGFDHVPTDLPKVFIIDFCSSNLHHNYHRLDLVTQKYIISTLHELSLAKSPQPTHFTSRPLLTSCQHSSINSSSATQLARSYSSILSHRKHSTDYQGYILSFFNQQ